MSAGRALGRYIFRGMEPEEPVLSSGFICQFSDLQIRAVLLDDVMRTPDHPDKDFLIDFETKSLRCAPACVGWLHVGPCPPTNRFLRKRAPSAPSEQRARSVHSRIKGAPADGPCHVAGRHWVRVAGRHWSVCHRGHHARGRHFLVRVQPKQSPAKYQQGSIQPFCEV